MKKILKDRENQIIAIMSVLTIIVAISPLLSRYCINGHDIEYHLLRIEALKENILIGRPFLKVNTLYFGGAGYASSLFYSDFLLYVPAILRVLGLSIKTSYHFYATLCVVLCFISAYYCASKITSSKYAGLIAGMLITLCPYHMDDVLVRAAAGEYMAFIFVPLVVYGIYNCLYQEMDKPLILGIGFIGVILSHTATIVMCVCFCLVACLIKVKTFIKNPKVIVKLLCTAIITALVTAFYWLPMLEQFTVSKFYINNGGGVDMLDAAVDFSQVLSQTFPTIGIALFIFAVPRVFIKEDEDRVIEFADYLVIGGIIFSLLATNLFPWTRFAKILSFVQFPWRLFLMASIMLSIADALIISKVIESECLKINNSQAVKDAAYKIFAFAIFSTMAFTALIHQNENAQGYYSYSDDYYSYKPYTASVIGGEWLPQAVTNREVLVVQSEELLLDNGEPIDFARSKGKIIATVSKSADYADVPFIYYKGYEASINDGQGITKLNVSGDGDNGMCRVYLEGKTGDLVVTYKGTLLQKVSAILTIVGLGITVLYIISNKKKPKEEE